ncbi:uncharacterized protein EURHEDRAFT_379885 [Aspergillus ruber CBS 135680]|uniref:Uncharacterized protein n=1 Tax=Aspergillus ruber (strain CBS 135680) TaxID=1388766 RepID=A0A017S6T6_ASPRC|nr:uncharacterized protein EURHEDRAFT_379885 [Aspergillus ruber CBS 135680]EYE92753.1 hypothetical protein EURHEDRAFT_379885 [Aspergillus ruber CBS 135680]
MPSKMVNKPVDGKQKEQSINQKLQLYGIYHGFKHGKLPSNKQCDIALNSALQSKTLSSPSKDLSEEGQKLVGDLREVIDEARKLILSKNDGHLLQEFIWEAQRLGDVEAKGPNAPIDKDGAKQDSNNAVQGLKTLGTLLITNGEFRKILSDALIIIRDMASDASQSAANKLRPSEEQLSQVDQAAEENTWHEKPDKEQLKAKLKRNKGDRESVLSGPSASADGTSEVSKSTRRSTKERAREYAGKGKEYLSEKVPKERREQAIWRLKKMVMEVQGHADYQRAIETLLDLAEKYARHSQDLSKQGTGSIKDVRGHNSVRTVETNLRVLLERFANSTSLDDFFDSLETIYRDAEKDPELKGWFKNVNTFVRKCLQEQGYVMEEDCNRDWNHLYDHGRYLLQDRYKSHTTRVLDEIKFFGEQYNEDSQNKAFGEAMNKLFLDLGRSSEGKMAFKKHLLKDIGNVILPGIFEHVRYVPIPRIEVSDPMVDVVVENLVIESDNLMPNVLEFGSDNYFRWGRKQISSKRDNKLMISASGIQADLTDVSYYLKKKKGFPSVTDKGVMDILLGGEGFGFKIAASIANKEDREHIVKVDKVSVDIHNMDIKLRKSKHKVLFKTFKPLLFKIVRPTLEKVLEQKIRESFITADNFARDVHNEAQKAEELAKKNDTEDKTSIYARYLDVCRRKLSDKRKKAQEEASKRDTKVQTTATLRDSQFPEIKLPGSVTTKATEYADLAEKGERWESPVFSLGNASESTDVPKPAPITRKPHRAGSVGGSETAGAANGTTNGADGVSKPDGYPSRGFSDEINQAFGTQGGNVAAGSNGAAKNVADGTTVPGAPAAFNPQTV